MAWQIVATYNFPKEILEKIYEVPAWAGISNLKIVVNNYKSINKDDTITIYTVWWPWRYLSWSLLKRVGSWTDVTDDEKEQRMLYRWTLKNLERYVEENLYFWDLDQIWWYSYWWNSNLICYWDVESTSVYIETLKWKVVDWTITAWEKEQLALLMWWSYNYNENNCNCS